MTQKPTVITVYLSKGGVAKSTLAALLAVHLAEQGQRVAVIDLDRQGTQTEIFDVYGDQGRIESLHLVLKRQLDAAAALIGIDGDWPGALYVLPGGAMTPLAVEEVKLNPTRFGAVGTEDIIRKPINDLAGVVDYVIIDVGPSDQVLSVGALLTTDHLVIPLEASRSSIERVGDVLAEVEIVRQYHPLHIVGLVPVKVRLYFGGLRASKSVQVAREVLDAEYADLLLKDAAGRVEIPFDEDWEVVRWAGEFQLSKAEFVKPGVKIAAERFAKAVMSKVAEVQNV